MALVGYARVSTLGQSLEVQLDKLEKYGCGDEENEIFKEKKSGTDSGRPQLKACLKFMRKYDTLVVTKLDRLARSTLDLAQIADNLNKRGIALKVLDQDIDTSTPTGKLLFNMLASIAEFETALRAERQAEGIAKAKAKGVRFGRKASLTPEQVEQLKQDRADGMLIKDVGKKYKLSNSSVYRLLDLPKQDEEITA